MKNYISYSIIALSFVLMVVGCNAEKKAVRQEKRQSDKALKHIQKAERIMPAELARWCAKRYNPADSIHEKEIYLPGKPILLQGRVDTFYVDCDKEKGKVKVPCRSADTVRITDTLYKDKYQRDVNRSAEDSLQAYYKGLHAKDAAVIKEQSADIATLKERNRILLYFVIGLAAYTLLRWILRIWGVKLP